MKPKGSICTHNKQKIKELHEAVKILVGALTLNKTIDMGLADHLFALVEKADPDYKEDEEKEY